MNTFQTIFFWAGITETIFILVFCILVWIAYHSDKKYENREQNWRERYTK